MVETTSPEAETHVPVDSQIDDANRLRVCSISGLVGALAIVVAFFLPWVKVEPEAAEAYRERLLQRLDDDRRPPPPHAEDWRRLAEHVGRDRAAAGIDIFWWARIASVDEEGNSVTMFVHGAAAKATRAIRVGAVWLGALPVLSVLLFAYFLTHHCKRARSPALITAMLVGAAAVLTTAFYNVISGALGQELESDVGLSVLLLGGAVLFLAGSFGVKARNWWRVFGGTILVAGILAIGIASYVRGPDDPAEETETETEESTESSRLGSCPPCGWSLRVDEPALLTTEIARAPMATSAALSSAASKWGDRERDRRRSACWMRCGRLMRRPPRGSPRKNDEGAFSASGQHAARAHATVHVATRLGQSRSASSLRRFSRSS